MRVGEELPEDGIREGFAWDEYRKLNAMNATTLLWGLNSMQHLKAAIDGTLDRKETPALAFGKALHCRLLEPSLYKTLYTVAEPCSARLKSGRRAGEPCGASGSYTDGSRWYCGTHKTLSSYEPTDVISATDSASIEAIYRAVRNHKVVNLIRQHGGYEVTAVAAMRGVKFKIRLDKLILDGNCPPSIVDLKKTTVGGAAIQKFERSVDKYNYDVRAAMYVDVIKALTGKLCHFIWVVVEDGFPHGINVIHADLDTIRVGRAKYRGLTDDFLRCVEADDWPGYTNDIIPGGLSKWGRREYGEMLAGSEFLE